ncbi:MAG: tyrosine--tRNA ligase [Chloroflexi bacterium]|nr:tyrosine--tRNA ligase [Chloroflexota bacterium]
MSASVEQQAAAIMRGAEFGDEATRRTMERELRERLAEGRPLRVYCGYDPTAVDLHLGHTLTMRKLRTFQDFGHEVTFLIGNFTGLVGDPSDTDKTRPMLSPEQLEENSQTYVDQAFRILDRERTIVRRNADWLGALGFGDVLRLASHFTVAQFLERDNLARRFERHDPIHVSEFLYALMQAYDAVAMETDVQVGGSDQLFNLMAGRVLQREYGQQPQIAITLPLLNGTDGNLKMSKSLGNHIGIDEPPNDLFGKVMSIPDSSLRSYFTLLTDLSDVEIEALLAGAPMEAKKRLAFEITTGLHDPAAAEAARDYFESTFQRRQTPDAMPEYALSADGDGGPSGRLDRVLVDAQLAKSGAEVRRLVEQGAVRVNGEPVDAFDRAVHPGDELRVGRRRFLRLVANPAAMREPGASDA